MDIIHAELSPWNSDSNPQAIIRDSFSPASVVLSISMGLYGAVVLLIFRCARALLDHRNDQTPTFKRALLYYLGILFSLETTFVALHQERVQLVTQVITDDNQNQVAQIMVMMTYDFVNNIAGSLCGLLIIWIADALLIYRCYQFNQCRVKPVFGAVMLYFLCIASSGPLLGLFNSVHGADYEDTELPGRFNWPKEAAGTLRLGQYMPLVVNSSFTLMLNTLLFAMIMKRLVRQNKELRSLYGPNAVANGIPYAPILVMLIESSSLVVVACPTYMIFQCFYTRVNLFFLNVHAQVISTCLIIIGVANRRTDYATIDVNIGSLRFGPPVESKPQPPISINTSWVTATHPLAEPPQAFGPNVAIRPYRRGSWSPHSPSSPLSIENNRSSLTHH